MPGLAASGGPAALQPWLSDFQRSQRCLRRPQGLTEYPASHSGSMLSVGRESASDLSRDRGLVELGGTEAVSPVVPSVVPSVARPCFTKVYSHWKETVEV